MPSAPLRPCAQLGCKELVKSGRCALHAKQQSYATNSIYDAGRESSSKRGYDRTWYAFLDGFRRGVDLADDDPDFAAKIIARNRCTVCGTRHNLHYDHIIPLEDGGPRLDPDNVQPLCQPHHNAKTRRETEARHADRRQTM